MRILASITKLLLSLCLIFSFTAQAAPQSVYELEYNSLDGKNVHLENYQGKVILLNYWATWCPPCIKELPSMQRLQEHFKDQPFEIIAVNVGQPETTVSSFLMELDTEITFSILLDEKAKSFAELNILGLPMSVLVDHKGQVVKTIMGGIDWDSKQQITQIEKLIGDAP